MYMTRASVAPENVCFRIPELAFPDVRELSAWEIDAVSGGARIFRIEIDFQRSVTVGGFGAFFGGVAGSFGGPLGTAGGVVVGFVGGFVTDVGIQIFEQSGRK